MDNYTKHSDGLPNGEVIRAAIQTYGRNAVTSLLAGGFSFDFDFCEGTGARVLSKKSVQNFDNLLHTKQNGEKIR